MFAINQLLKKAEKLGFLNKKNGVSDTLTIAQEMSQS